MLITCYCLALPNSTDRLTWQEKSTVYDSKKIFVLIQILLCFGAHRRVVAPSILVSRSREVLFDFAMDCDETGKLILKPRPATAWTITAT